MIPRSSWLPTDQPTSRPPMTRIRRLASRNRRARVVDWFSPISAPTRFATRLQPRVRGGAGTSAAPALALPATGRSGSSSAWDIASIVIGYRFGSYGPSSEMFLGVGRVRFPTCARGGADALAGNIRIDKRRHNRGRERTHKRDGNWRL